MSPAKLLAVLPLVEPVARFFLAAVAHRHTDAMTPQEADEAAEEAINKYRVALARRNK